jgi:hypothetical protein
MAGNDSRLQLLLEGFSEETLQPLAFQDFALNESCGQAINDRSALLPNGGGSPMAFFDQLALAIDRISGVA